MSDTDLQKPAPAHDIDGHNVAAFLAGLISGQLGTLNEEGYLKIVAIEDPIESPDGTRYQMPIQLASGRRLTVTTELVGWAP